MQVSSSTSEIAQLKQKYIHAYSLSYKSLFKDSWQLTRGAKGSLWLALFLYCLIKIAMLAGEWGVQHFAGSIASVVFQIVLFIVLSSPLMVGLKFLGVQRATGQSIKASTIFSCINCHTIKHLLVINLWLFLIYFITAVLVFGIMVWSGGFSADGKLNFNFTIIGLLIIPASIIIYFTQVYSMATLLVASQKISGWHALTLSRLAVNRHFFKIFLLNLLMIVISIPSLAVLSAPWVRDGFSLVILAMVSLISVIFSIWIMPCFIILKGKLFNIMFSLPPESVAKN